MFAGRGGRLVRHARRLVFQLAEVAVPKDVFSGKSWAYRRAPSSTGVVNILEVIEGDEQ